MFQLTIRHYTSLCAMVLSVLFSIIILKCVLGADIRPIKDVVRDYGYDIQTHTVITSDRYKLTVHRLMRGSHHQDTTPETPSDPPLDLDYGTPVLVVLGVLQSSASYLAKGNGIAYSLAEKGFDVWLPNYRGNMYSRDHETLLPSQPEFWNFTLHEMGTKDLPAVIDYVLDATHRQQLIYLGFSMGTTMFWILTSSLPVYQTKVTAMVAVAPVARPSNMVVINNSVLRSLLYTWFTAMWTLNACETLPYGETVASTIDWICTQKFGSTCQYFLTTINQLRQQEMEIDSAFKLIPYSPAGISTKVLMHYIQIAGAERFQQFDYGAKGNQEEYGSPQPPEYDLKKINLPIYFIHSDQDQVATPEDVEWLSKQLPRRPERKIESVNKFRHVDFSLNTNLENILTRPLTSLVIQLAEEHSNFLTRVDFAVNNV